MQNIYMKNMHKYDIYLQNIFIFKKQIENAKYL